METILEQQRRYHEEKERLMDVMAKEMLTKKSTLRDQINSDHRTRAMQDRYMEVSGNLRDLYDDKDGLRKEELNAISGPNEFAEFYNRLEQISESESEDEENEIIYNPKNLPLGWDGKPIPYWEGERQQSLGQAPELQKEQERTLA